MLGPEEVTEVFGVTLEAKDIPPIPFSREELERAKELNQFLVLRLAKAEDGSPLSMAKMAEKFEQRLKDEDKGKPLYDTDWYKNEDFFLHEAPTTGWSLVSKEPIADSVGKNYLGQTEMLVSYLEEQVFKDREMSDEYRSAIDEFNREKDAIAGLIDSDWKTAAEKLAHLAINKLCRQTPAEAMYDLIFYLEKNDQRLLEKTYSWTKSRSSDGQLVGVGDFDAVGLSVDSYGPGDSNPDVGVSFSRSA
jgi:hypothetical protein